MLMKKEDNRPQDPDDVMMGRCTTCRLDVEVPRWKCRPPVTTLSPGRYMGAFTDCWMCECPRCSACITVMTRPGGDREQGKKEGQA